MPTWMIADDEPDIYEVLLAMFEIWGIEGVAFVDGGQVLTWIEDVDQGRIRGELPEVLITDIRMPEASGVEVAQRIRQSPLLKKIPIILMTAYRLAPEEENKAFKAADADHLMYKPLPGMPELRSRIEEIITERNWRDEG